ncbi:MAG: phospholipase [Campylobacteraceae bacterium]|nr:phospholipase [Campylobacteraceae bacterium]
MQIELQQFLFSYLFYLFGGIVILITLLHMLHTRRPPASMIGWLLFMIIAPYIFVLFYYFFGVRKHSKAQEKNMLNANRLEADLPSSSSPNNTLIHSHNIPLASKNNNLKLFTNSQVAYFEFVKALNEAKSSIDLSAYVVKYDDVTSVIFDILVQKAKEGVKVRFIIDALGSYRLYFWQKPLKKLREAGVDVHFFAPLFDFRNFTKLNLRYHRKIFIIDNSLVFSGGMNLSNEYMGASWEKDRWLDLMFKVKGDSVQDYMDIFNSDMAYVSQKKLEAPIVKQNEEGSQLLQTLPSGPDVRGDILLEVILSSIYKAEKRIWIITPYFIPDESILQALKIASHKNIDIKIITPRKSNHPVADLARSSYIRNLYEYDIDVVLYEGKMIHAKALLFDDESLFLGSSNLDYRSLLLNYEIVTISYAKEHILHMEKWMKSLMCQPHSKLKSAGKMRRIFENSVRIFASQL